MSSSIRISSYCSDPPYISGSNSSGYDQQQEEEKLEPSAVLILNRQPDMGNRNRILERPRWSQINSWENESPQAQISNLQTYKYEYEQPIFISIHYPDSMCELRDGINSFEDLIQTIQKNLRQQSDSIEVYHMMNRQKYNITDNRTFQTAIRLSQRLNQDVLHVFVAHIYVLDEPMSQLSHLTDSVNETFESPILPQNILQFQRGYLLTQKEAAKVIKDYNSLITENSRPKFRQNLAIIYGTLAEAYYYAKQYDVAECAINQALDISIENDDYVNVANWLITKSQIHCQGDFKDVLDLRTRAIKIIPMNRPDMQAFTLTMQALYHSVKKDKPVSVQDLQEVYSLLQHVHDLRCKSSIFTLLLSVRRISFEDYITPEEMLEEIESAKRKNYVENAIRLQYQLGLSLLKQGEFENSIKQLIQAVMLGREHESVYEAIAEKYLMEAYFKMQETKDVKDYTLASLHGKRSISRAKKYFALGSSTRNTFIRDTRKYLQDIEAAENN